MRNITEPFAMKKNYKPLDRHSKGFVLNCDKMGIDEYWETANHELDETSVSLDFSSDTHREPKQYKKSFDKEYAQELNTVDITGISESEAGDTYRHGIGHEFVKSGGGENARNTRTKEILEKVFGNEVESKADGYNVSYEYENTSLNKSSDTDFRGGGESGDGHASDNTYDGPGSESESRSAEKARTYNVGGKKIKTEDFGNKNTHDSEMKRMKKNYVMKKSKDAPVDRKGEKRKYRGTEVKPAFKRRATTYVDDSFQVEAYASQRSPKRPGEGHPEELTMGKSREVIGVANAKNLVSGRSDYKRISGFENMESGVLFLRKSAVVKNEKAEQNIAMSVLKGRVTVEIEKNSFALKSGALVMIRRGWVYSVLSTSVNGAVVSFVASSNST